MIANPSESQSQIAEPCKQHLEKMSEIFKSGQMLHYQAFPEIFCSADDEDAVLRYLRTFCKPKNPFKTRRKFALAWFVNNEVHGYLLYHLHKTSDVFFGRERWMCFIEDIAIDNSSRSKGGASQLINHLMTELKTLGNCLVSAQVWRGNEPSEALFSKYNFDAKSKHFYCVID